MKKTTRILVVCVLLLGVIFALAACSENTKQKAISTEIPDGAVVVDNGGMAVQYGSYVYFVNGYVGSSADNTFGDVVKGAICRATLKNGEPDYTTVEVVVPKNVYGSDTKYPGIYIVDGYIYYHSTSVEKNSKREYKTDEGVLMRTSLDGSKTDTLVSFDDNASVIYAGDNSHYVVYVTDNYAYSLDPSTKKSTLLSVPNAKNPDSDKQTVVAYNFAGDYMVYTMYNYAIEPSSNYNKDYVVWAYNLKTGENKKIMDSSIYGVDGMLFTTTVKEIVPTAEGFKLYYTKTGNVNNQSNGYYMYAFSATNPTFDKSKEVRYTIGDGTSYTRFFALNNGYSIAFADKFFDVFDDNDGGKGVARLLGDNTTSLTLIDVVETNDEVFARYIASDVFTYFRLYSKANDVYTVADDGNAIKFFSGKYDSSYVTYDVVNNVIYYLNENMNDNAYYYVIPAMSDLTPGNDVDIATGKILGIFTNEDEIALLKK